MLPLVVVDTQVILHNIANALDTLDIKDITQRRAITEANLAYIDSGLWCQELIGPVETLWVNDKKINGEYWRHEYLRKEVIWASIPRKTRGKVTEKQRLRYLDLRAKYLDHLSTYVLYLASEHVMPNKEYQEIREMMTLRDKLIIHYKAGRSYPSYSLQVVRDTFYNSLPKLSPVLQHAGYEADDMASLVVRLAGDREIILLTVDTDWLGLCSDRVTWVCATGYKPRVRCMMDGSLASWAKRKLKADITEPRDIWKIKAEQGDPSDALPPGSPIEVIDLLSPAYDLIHTHMRQEVLSLLDSNHPSVPCDQGLSAKHYLVSVHPKTIAVPGLTEDQLTLSVDRL